MTDQDLIAEIRRLRAQIDTVRDVLESSAFDTETREWGTLEVVHTAEIYAVLGDEE